MLEKQSFQSFKIASKYPQNSFGIIFVNVLEKCRRYIFQFYQTIHQHIGEAEAIGENGKCSNPYLVPSLDRTVCSLPGRIDVARHYFIYGGVEGLKESYEDLSNRLQSFGRYIFNISEYPAVQSLFASDSFQKYAKSICPKTKQFLDPFQFNFIIQVCCIMYIYTGICPYSNGIWCDFQIPGQTVALHLDAPYFWGASRFQYPQWLLVVMVFSGLFRDRFVDQIQVSKLCVHFTCTCIHTLSI